MSVKRDLLSHAGKIIYKFRGWTFEDIPDYWQDKQVLIAFPHVSIFDTVMAFAGFAIIKKKGHVMVKREAFIGPFSPLLKKIGAIPVTRHSKSGIVADMVKIFQEREEFQLSMVPEGTRGDVKKIKTGFWHIAKQANVPIICWYLDNVGRQTRWAGQIYPTDDMQADMAKIKELYKDVGYELPPFD